MTPNDIKQSAVDFIASMRKLFAMQEALEFYANPAHYRTTSTGFAAQYDPNRAAILVDGGERARKALKGDA